MDYAVGYTFTALLMGFVLVAVQGALGFMAAKFTSEENNVNYGRFWLGAAVFVAIITLQHFSFLQVVGISFVSFLLGMGAYLLVEKFDVGHPDHE
ncbi:MAG: hypothetical protein H6780_03285 [Candidatus Nomurabacteria bacterium]|nr:MAG: hypothetical protein H6780_03285 [Candidatus Nomurabacteria bacterium]